MMMMPPTPLAKVLPPTIRRNLPPPHLPPPLPLTHPLLLPLPSPHSPFPSLHGGRGSGLRREKRIEERRRRGGGGGGGRGGKRTGGGGIAAAVDDACRRNLKKMVAQLSASISPNKWTDVCLPTSPPVRLSVCLTLILCA